MTDERQLYIELLKKTLRNDVYREAELRPLAPSSRARRMALTALRKLDLTLVRQTDFRRMQKRVDHAGSPPYAHTMLSQERLDNIQYCVESVLNDEVPGDFAETGVWRGGAVALMLGVLKAHGVTDRKVWAADSFEGLPPPDLSLYPADSDIPWHAYPDAKVSVEQVRENLKRYDLLSEQVHFLKGWFRDTLGKAPVDRLAVLRLDGDMYESTMDALVPLYPKVSGGGFVIIDDYFLPACKKAVHDYRDRNAITSQLVRIDDESVYWRVPR
jgi:O-methyltransferase